MGEEAQNPNPIYITSDLVEEILLRLPLKPVLRFKTVSKQWKSILESKSFAENRMNLLKCRKILAAYTCHPDYVDPEPSLFEGDEEIVYLKCDHARRFSSMICDGMVCFVETYWVEILNTSTRQILQIPWGKSTLSSGPLSLYGKELVWKIGFGRDKVTGSYKVVKMCVLAVEECDILDVGTGEWRKLMSSPPYKVDFARPSVCVNGSIYWLIFSSPVKLLALNLHTEEFHDVSIPTELIKWSTELMDLEDHLAFSRTKKVGLELFLEIWSMDTYQEQWSKTYSISLAGLTNSQKLGWFTRVTVSKSGNVFFCHNNERLFKYYPKTDDFRLLSSKICAICAISPYIENLVPLLSEPDHRLCSKISKVLKWIKSRILAFCWAF